MNEGTKQALIQAGIPVEGYSLSKFEKDIEAIRPRFIDMYVLPPLMLWFAHAARKRGMPKIPSRILFTGGIYMLYRNYSRYKQAIRGAYEYARARREDQGNSQPA